MGTLHFAVSDQVAVLVGTTVWSAVTWWIYWVSTSVWRANEDRRKRELGVAGAVELPRRRRAQ